jgi:thiol-disulfide isomerase/thioredoxin
MQIQTDRYRWRCLIMVFGAGLLICSVLFGGTATASPQTIQTLSSVELNAILSSDNSSSLVFFTAAWCGYCKAMLPALNRLYQRFNGNGLRFIGISVDAGNADAMQQVLAEKRVDFPMFWIGENAIDDFRLVGIPMIFLSKNGKLVEKIPGKCSYAFLEGKILEMIK